MHDGENIMVILSSPSGVGKTTLTKKFNKNTKILEFLFLIPQGPPRSNEVEGRLLFYFTQKV